MASLGQPRKWLSFGEWLEQQRGKDGAASEAGTAPSEDCDGPLEPAGPSPAVTVPPAPSAAAGSHVLTSAAAAPAASSAAPPSTSRPALRPVLADCRSEVRVASECSRARQEALVMLAAPGLPLHRAPVLTARQAQSLMAAVAEPLISIPAGRLTRKLTAPTKLEATESRGQISLWLLPSDDLVLMWHTTAELASAGAASRGMAGQSANSSRATPATAETSGSTRSVTDTSSDGTDCSGSSSSDSQPALDVRHEACSVSVWEEVAHFPSHSHLTDDAPLVTIHMLRGDATGRSFYIRVRDDIAAEGVESALRTVPTSSSSGHGGGSQRAAAEQLAPRLYFWLTDSDVNRALCSLGRLKSLLKRPPTLARRSGVPERQLEQVGAWLHEIEAHQQTLAAAQAAQHASGPGMPVVSEATPSSLSPGMLLGRSRSPAAVSSGLKALLTAASSPHAAAQHAQQMQGTQAGAVEAHGEGEPSGSEQGGTAAVDEQSAPRELHTAASASATALAVYQDTAFFGGGIVVPVSMTVSVTVALSARGTEALAQVLAGEACERAKRYAESHTRLAVDHSGRQQVECRLAEVMVQKARQQRHRVRAARHEARRAEARRAAAQESLQLLRAAEARAAQVRMGGARHGSSSGGSTSGAHPAVQPTASSRPGSCATPVSAGVQSSDVAGVASAEGDTASSRQLPGAVRGSKVTITNLASVLEDARLDADAQLQGAGQADAGSGGRAGSASGVTVADLGELLRHQE